MRRVLAGIAFALLAAAAGAQERGGINPAFVWPTLFQVAGAPTAYHEDSAHVSGHYGNLVLGVRNDAGTSLCGTTGDYCPFQLDASGQVRVVAAQTGTWDVRNISGTITLPTGAATDRTTAAGPFSFQLSDGAAFYVGAKTGQLPSALVSGRLDVNVGAGAVTANAGTNLNTSALALDATLTGGTQKTKIVDTGGTNVATVSAAGAVKVDGSAVTQPVSGTVTTTPPSNASSNVAQFGGTNVSTGTGVGGAGIPRVTVSSDSTLTASQGGAPWQVQSNSANIATETTLGTLSQAQGSTTSGQKGPLVQGAVTTAAPTYTTGQTSPVSLTTAGLLRVDHTGAYEVEPHITGTLNAACADPCKTSLPPPAGSVLKFDLHSFQAVQVDITTGSAVGTFACESSIDDENWVALTCVGGNAPVPRGAIVNPASWTSYVPNIWPGGRYFRLRCSALTSGSIGVTLHASRVDSYNNLLPVSSWPNIFGAGTTEVSQRVVNIGGGDGGTGCNGNPCTRRGVWLNSTPTGSEYALLTRDAGGDLTSAGSLTAACADPCTGTPTAGSTVELQVSTRMAPLFLMSASTLTGTIKFEESVDHVNWASLRSKEWTTLTDGPAATGWVNPTGAPKEFSLYYREGIRYVRVRCSAFTSGSATFTISASGAVANSTAVLGIPGTPATVFGQHITGTDTSTACGGGACERHLTLTNAAPGTSDYGVITRDVPAAGDFGVSSALTQRVIQSQELTYAGALTLKTATAAGTGPFFSICGSSTKTVRVQQIDIGGTVATAAINADVVIKKTSAATSAGTATALTKVPLDSNSAASTVNLLNFYTVLATAGTLVGAIDSRTGFLPVAPAQNTPVQFRWNEPSMVEAATLRGTAQCLEANFGTTTTNAPTLTVSVRWTEK